MKRSLVMLLAVVVVGLSGLAPADVTVFLDHSTPQCPIEQNGPMSGYWGQCNNLNWDSTWTPPAGFLCIDNEDTSLETCIHVDGSICCSYQYYTDNDSRTMKSDCSSFTSAQAYHH